MANPWGTWGNSEETTVGVGKSGMLEHKSGNISDTPKTERSHYRVPMRSHQWSFEPPMASFSTRLRVHNPHPKLKSLLYEERVKLPISNLASSLYSHGLSQQMARVGVRGRCRITPPRFMAECRKRRLNQGSFVSAVSLVVYFL